MNEIKVMSASNNCIMLNAYGLKKYADVGSFDRKKLKDRAYVFEKISKLIHPEYANQQEDMVLVDCPTIIFPQNVVEAARILMAMSMFKSFREDGLITEEEFMAIVKVGEEKCRKALQGDRMLTKRADLKEESE